MLFSRGAASGYTLLVDVGSGSIGLAVVAGDSKADFVWSHREHTPLKVTDSLNQSSKAVITAIMNALLIFESEGRPALLARDASARITTIQATVAAPWSYTVARTVTFSNDEPFVITKDLLENLAKTAADQAIAEFSAEHSLTSLGVQETSRTILDAHANGYRITTPNKQQATQLCVTHVSTLIRKEIVVSLTKLQEKLFAEVPLEITSFMLANYYVTDAIQATSDDYCLVDVTNEATELGIVRQNTLQYSTHIAFGRASLAREVSAATEVTMHEAFTSIRTLHQQENLHDDISAALAAYQDQLILLFKETGDRLTIPKHIYLQADAGLADFFAPIVERAGKAASKGNVLVTPLTPSKLKYDGTLSVSTDTALLVAKSFFHTKPSRTYFFYL